MKYLRKLMTTIVAMIMMLAMSTPAMAQTVTSTDNGSGSITISNAAKGEEYAAYLLFEATLSTDKTNIAYKGTIPDGLGEYFAATSEGSGYVQTTAAAFKNVTYYTDAAKTTPAEDGTTTDYWTGTDMSDGLKGALKTWASSASPTVSAISDGSDLVFNGLKLGYYVVTTSQGESLISVDSTMPSATIIDKNTTEPTAVKAVDGTSFSIGETITYTGTFNTANYIGEEQVKSYTISDTLPEFLSDVKITSVNIIQSTVDKTNYPDVNLSAEYTAFSPDKRIVIPWVNNDNNSLYKNGSQIVITYTAKLTSTVNVNADNTNTITITPNKDISGDNPFNKSYYDDRKVTTYAAALKKTDGSKALAGAKFAFKGLTAEKNANGIYVVTKYDSASEELGTEMEVDSYGKLYIVGLKENVSLVGKETVAPNGYNKLTTDVTLTPQKLTEEVFHTEGTRYYDAKGNLVSESSSTTTSKTVNKNLNKLDENAVEVINNAGTELPSTGGIGTTIFYIVGGIMVAGAVVFLLTKRRVAGNE